jgi:hypothetical protein
MYQSGDHSRYVYHGRDKETFDDRMQKGIGFLEELFKQHPRLLFVRVDLDYHEAFNQITTVDQALEDFRHLYVNLNWNPKLSKGYLGYIRKLESGFHKGLHFHVLFIYDADIRQGDIYLGQYFGEYWKTTITQGRGYHHNVNMASKNYKDHGLGKVHRNDLDKIQSLIDVLKYLAKVEQVPPDSKGRRLFEPSR